MPVIYRSRAQSTSFETSTPPRSHSVPVPTDADESIVLSDLVRQGEASRLRRRGAMRLDHAPMVAQHVAPMQDWSQPPIASPTWESEPDPEPDDGPIFARNFNVDRERGYRATYGYGSGRVRGRGDAFEEGDEFGYVLFCGGEESDGEMDVDVPESHWSTAPYEPSVLPLYPPTRSSASSPSRRPRPRTNGCGALLHMHASPRRRLGVWSAKNETSTGAIIGLDAAYFDRAAVAKIVRSACGCVREGVGCAVCGNPLGTRYKPCKTAAEGIFASISHTRPHISTPLHPEGPRYWHAQSRTIRVPSPATLSQPSSAHLEAHGSHDHPNSATRGSKSGFTFYVYTFFSTSVSSSPSFKFPSRSNTILPAPDPQPQPIRRAYPQSQSRPQPNMYQPQPSTQPPNPLLQSRTTPAANATSDNDNNNDNDNGSSNNNNDFVPEINIIVDYSTLGSPETPAFVTQNLSPRNALIFDRTLTDSPAPISDAGDGLPEVPEAQAGAGEDVESLYTYRYQYRYQGEDGYPYPYQPLERRTEMFDPDGEFIPEPESPDKTGEVMLFPER